MTLKTLLPVSLAVLSAACAVTPPASHRFDRAVLLSGFEAPLYGTPADGRVVLRYEPATHHSRDCRLHGHVAGVQLLGPHHGIAAVSITGLEWDGHIQAKNGYVLGENGHPGLRGMLVADGKASHIAIDPGRAVEVVWLTDPPSSLLL